MANILLIAYDNGSHLPFFPLNIFYLYFTLKKAGHVVCVWHQDIHHGSPKYLTNILDKNPFDIVGLGFVAGYYQYRVAKQLAEAINASKRRKDFNFVIGGHGPAAEPEYFKETLSANTVVIGDGERAATEIAETNATGILYSDPCSDDNVDIGAYQDFPIDIYRLIRWPTSTATDFCFPILSSRGCKWACSFCYRMRNGFHQRDVRAIMEEIKYLHDNWQINHFQFADELLMASKQRTGEICEAILRLPFRMKWDCNGRLNYATSRTLQLMKNAGCEYINYGIESLNQDILNQMSKGLNIHQIVRGVERTLQAKIFPGLNLIWGFPGDTRENLQKSVGFLRKYDPCHELRTIRPVTPYPGTKLYALAKEKGLIEGPADFYENKHKNSDLFSVNFMDISTEYAHSCLKAANRELYRNYLDKHRQQMDQTTHKLYTQGDTSFRGFRAI